MNSKKPRIPPKKREEAESIVIDELKKMIPFFLIANALLLTSLLIYGFLSDKDIILGVFTGVLTGNFFAVLNYYLIGYTAGKAVRRKDPKKAKRMFKFSYAVRYLVMFAAYGLLISFKLVNPVAAVIPLLYPGSYYKIKAIFNKSV